MTTALLNQAFTSGVLNDGSTIGYGFGCMTQVYLGVRHVAQGGSLCAYNNYIIRFLDHQLTVIVLINHQYVPGPRVRAHEVAKLYLGM